MDSTYTLSLNGETFNNLKMDFEQMLQNLLTEMKKRGSQDGSLTIKLNVTLTPGQARDYDSAADGAMRDITKPLFAHKMSTVMQLKNERSGQNGGNFELVWDEASGEWVMKEIDNGQTSIFDHEDGVYDAEYSEVNQEPTRVPGLPEPVENGLPAPDDDDYGFDEPDADE